MDMRDALLLLAARYRKNIVPSPAVQGKLAFVNLYNVRFEEAMDAILGTDFKYEERGNLIKVFPRDKGQMVHQVFTLYYIRAAEAQKLVEQVLSEGARIQVTTAAEIGVPFDTAIGGKPVGGDTTAMNDTLIVYDYPENVRRAEEVIQAIDVCPKQVLVEATVLSAALTDDMEFGIDWQTLEGPAISELADLAVGSPGFLQSTGSSAQVGGSALGGGMRIGLVHHNVATFIKAVEQVTDVTVLANPKILAVNKQLGQIYIGKKIAYQSQTTQTEVSTTEQVQFLETGTKLSFRPYVGNDGLIRMDVHPKDSSATLRTAGTSTLPDETSAELATNIIVKDGQTILIGGLFRDKITTTRTQVPLLGDLPLLGVLFRGKADQVQREEVIVLLTPHIIHDPNEVAGWAQEDDIRSKMSGAEEELQELNRLRLARDGYKAAVNCYVQGDDEAAMKKLDAVLRLHPTYLEAIQLKQMIAREQRVKALRKGR
jgi:type II secretory pathway component GspD/PulD (secretin)